MVRGVVSQFENERIKAFNAAEVKPQIIEVSMGMLQVSMDNMHAEVQELRSVATTAIDL